MPTRLQWQDAAILKAVSGNLEQRMASACILIRDQTRVLSNRGNARGNDPSLPGEPPKRVTGMNVKQMNFKVVRLSDGSVVGMIGTNVPYQPRLELGFVGTDSLGRVYHQQPRPAFRPAVQMSWPKIQQIFGVTA